MPRTTEDDLAADLMNGLGTPYDATQTAVQEEREAQLVICRKVAQALLDSVNKSVLFLVEGENGWHYTALLANVLDADVLIIGYDGGTISEMCPLTHVDSVEEIAETIRSYLASVGEDITTVCLNEETPSLPFNELVKPVDMCFAIYGHTMLKIAKRFAVHYEIENVVNKATQVGDYDYLLELRGGYSIGLTVNDGILYKDEQPYKTITELMKGK